MATQIQEWTFPMDGGCRCGQTRLRVSAPPLLASACHCTGCQTMSASAFSLSLGVPSAGFTVTQGEPILGGLRRESHHHFCPSCYSWMFTRTEGMDTFVNLRASMLDDHAWFAPYVELWTSEKLPWAATGAPRSFAKLPEMQDFEGLIREYAGWVRSPGA